MTLFVEKLSDLGELRLHRDAWNRLARETASAQFFQTFDWFEAYWQHYADGQSIHVLMVRDDADLIGIVPLVLRTETRRLGRLRVLTYPLDDWGSFYGPVSSDPERTVQAALGFIHQQPKNWDILSWRWIDNQHAATQSINDAMCMYGMRGFPSVRETAALIDLPGSWEDYVASRTGKFRNNMRRWERRVKESGSLRYLKHRPRGESHDDADPRWDLYDTCEQLAARSWQGSSDSGTTLSHSSIRPYLRDAHAAAVRIGAADLNLLYLDDQPIAFEYGYWWQGYKYSLRFGFDSGLSQSGVGNLMWLETIKASIEANDHTFDMGPGSLDYKRHYYTRLCDCQTIDHYRRFAPKAQAIALKNLISQHLPASVAQSH